MEAVESTQIVTARPQALFESIVVLMFPASLIRYTCRLHFQAHRCYSGTLRPAIQYADICVQCCPSARFNDLLEESRSFDCV